MTMYLWRPSAGQDVGIGSILSEAFAEVFDGAEMDDATARVWWARLQEEMEADAEMAGRKLIVFRATPHMLRQAYHGKFSTQLLSTYLEAIQNVLDEREAA